jgi:WD40 repeat protein
MASRLEGGHSDSVLCVIHTHGPEARLVSGGENGELCIWTPDGSSHHTLTLSEDGDITSMAASVLHPNIMYVSCGKKIFKLDIQQQGHTLSSMELNDDEINQISLNEKEELLCACDDSGVVRVINLAECRVQKTLRKHSNICATACFRPKRPSEIISGGYDSHLMQWDFSKGRSFCRINLEDYGTPPENVDSYLVSPPFIHSLAVSTDGSMLACGTESALVHLFSASKRNLTYLRTLRSHMLGVSQVHFPSCETDVLISGGNDGNIFLWRVTLDLLPPPTCNGHSDGSSPHEESISPFSSIKHGAKINWLASGVSAGQQKFIVVADNSSHLTLYPFPDTE